MSNKLMTQHEHVDRNGEFCPWCSSIDIEGGPVEIEGRYAIQEMGCNYCNSTWNDVYEQVGYSSFKEGEVEQDTSTFANHDGKFADND